MSDDFSFSLKEVEPDGEEVRTAVIYVGGDKDFADKLAFEFSDRKGFDTYAFDNAESNIDKEYDVVFVISDDAASGTLAESFKKRSVLTVGIAVGTECFTAENADTFFEVDSNDEAVSYIKNVMNSLDGEKSTINLDFADLRSFFKDGGHAIAKAVLTVNGDFGAFKEELEDIKAVGASSYWLWINCECGEDVKMRTVMWIGNEAKTVLSASAVFFGQRKNTDLPNDVMWVYLIAVAK